MNDSLGRTSGAALNTVGAENPVTLRDLGIFTDHAAEPVPAQDPDASARIGRMRASGGRPLSQRPVRTVGVVVVGVLAQD